jgi:sugar O-acyltransferase (sialic acid O-acetyltransferase NeuD family)
LVIVGAGGHGREALDIVEAINASSVPTFEFLGFLDDDVAARDAVTRRGHSILGAPDMLREIDAMYVIAIAVPAARRRIDQKLVAWGRKAATLMHPSATFGSDIRLAPGAIIAAGARLTTNCSVGRHFHANVNAVLSHDCAVGDYVTLSPGAQISGSVTLEDDVTVGANATVIQGLQIGLGGYVAAGAAVIRDVPAGTTVAGVPARSVKSDD